MPYSQEVADRICEALTEGPSLRKVCEAEGIKAPTFLLWVKERPELAEQYTRAKEAGRALRFERLREMTEEEPARDNYGKVDPGWVAWKRLAVDTEKWSLAREEPKKYGDKVQTEITGADGGPLKFEEIRRTIVDPKT